MYDFVFNKFSLWLSFSRKSASHSQLIFRIAHTYKFMHSPWQPPSPLPRMPFSYSRGECGCNYRQRRHTHTHSPSPMHTYLLALAVKPRVALSHAPRPIHIWHRANASLYLCNDFPLVKYIYRVTQILLQTSPPSPATDSTSVTDSF